MTTATDVGPSFGLDQLGQIALTVRDVDRAIVFYRDVLGLRFLFRAGDLAFFDCNGLRLLLNLPERVEAGHRNSILYFCVEDLNVAYTTLSGRGVAFIDQPHLVATMPDHELWMAFFTDLEGNTLALMSEKR